MDLIHFNGGIKSFEDLEIPIFSSSRWGGVMPPTTNWVPMEAYNLWAVLSGETPTSTAWNVTTSELTQTASQTNWSLVGWEPLFSFKDGAVNARIEYIEADDLDGQGETATAPVGLRVSDTGDGVFWKTNNGELQLIEREGSTRNILYTQSAPAVGTWVTLEAEAENVHLSIAGTEVFTGQTIREEEGFACVFLGAISQPNSVLVSDLSIRSGGFYSPMEIHPDYEVMPGGSEKSRFEYNDVLNDIYLSGATALDTAVINTAQGITSVCNFRGYIDWVGNTLHYTSFTACCHIQDTSNYLGLRTYNNSLQLWERAGGAFRLLYDQPCATGEYIEMLVNGNDVILLHNDVVNQLTTSLDDGYVGVINRQTQGGGRQRYWRDWFWTFDPQLMYDPIETSPDWDDMGGTLQDSGLLCVGTIVYQKVAITENTYMQIKHNPIPEFENGHVECIWRNSELPSATPTSLHLTVRTLNASNLVGFNINANGLLYLYGCYNGSWGTLLTTQRPIDGDRVRLTFVGDQYTVSITRGGVLIDEATAKYRSEATRAGYVGISQKRNPPNWNDKPLFSNLIYEDYDAVRSAVDDFSIEVMEEAEPELPEIPEKWESKQALKSWALETHGIKLNARKSIPNMLEDLHNKLN